VAVAQFQANDPTVQGPMRQGNDKGGLEDTEADRCITALETPRPVKN